MKQLLISLLVVIPLMAVARPLVSVFPLSPYFESGQTNTVLISIKNGGTNSIPIPSGLKMDNGIVIPTKRSFHGQYTFLTNGIPLPSHAAFGTGTSAATTIDSDLIEHALEHSNKDEVWNQLYGKHYLKPQEIITYKVTWICDGYPEYNGLNTVMISLFIEFNESDIEVPPISLYLKQKSNQQVDPIVTTPVDEVEAQSTQGHP